MNQESEKIIQHLNRIEGQVRGLQKMLQNERQCRDIIQQIIAVRSSLSSIGVQILNQNIQCHDTPEDRQKFTESISQLFKIT